MSRPARYNTKQRELLLKYLASVKGTHVTAADVCAYFSERGEVIGQSTVYRRLETLVDDGIVNKYVIGDGSPACFEYVGADEHTDKDVCFHCRCRECGRLIHLHCEELEEVEKHLLGEHRFKLDPVRTVFYGVCEDCTAADEDKE